MLSRSPGAGPSVGRRWWWLPLGITAAGVLLAFAGLEAEAPGSWLDHLYGGVQLVALDDGALDGYDQWTLDVGRWLAPLGAVLLAYRALLADVKSDVDYSRAGRLREHVVIAGLGDYGSRLASSFRAAGHRVVGIDVDPHPPTAPALRADGVIVLNGDACDPRFLKRAGIRRARYLIATCGEDGRNVQAAAAAGSLIEPGGHALTAFVHLEDLRLWPEMKARSLRSRGASPFRTEFFNVFETGARILLDAHPPFAAPHADAAAPRVLLVGLDGLGEQILLSLARRWEAARCSRSNRLAITVVAAAAGARVGALIARYPRLEQLAAIRAQESEPTLLGLEARGLLEADAAVVYVCLEHDADGVAAVLDLQVVARRSAIPLVLVLRDERRGLAPSIARDLRGLHGVEVFRLGSRALMPELLVRGTNEVLARGKHEQYVRTERERGVDERSNPSVTSWERLPESLKESNRAFVDRIGAKLDEAGCVLVPNSLAAGDHGFVFTPDEIEELARLEHRQWRQDLERDGWCHGPEKNAELKLHPLLVVWEELPEEERDKDRAAVRALPEMAALVGFDIARIEP